ncbi:hypothetical protein [Pseudomonas phage PIP]|nr:hypothetical protein [Pseudomonas phage PIP]
MGMRSALDTTTLGTKDWRSCAGTVVTKDACQRPGQSGSGGSSRWVGASRTEDAALPPLPSAPAAALEVGKACEDATASGALRGWSVPCCVGFAGWYGSAEQPTAKQWVLAEARLDPDNASIGFYQ